MRIIGVVLVFGISMWLSAGIIAQETGQRAQPSERSPARSTNSSSGPITIRGCISGGREAYTLAQASTGATFKLQGDSRQFEPVRNKLVEITGRELAPTNDAGVNELPKLAVDKVQVVGSQCPSRAGNLAPPAGTPAAIPQTQKTQPETKPPQAVTPPYEPSGAPNQTPPTVGNNPNPGGATGAPSPGSGNPPPPPPR